MRSIIYAALAMMLTTAIAGFWLQSVGLSTSGFGFPEALWPLGFAAYGGGVFLATALVNRRIIGEHWRTGRLEKSELRPAFALLFGPALALLLLGFAALSHFGFADKERMLVVLAIMQILFFIVMGNYAATLRYDSPGGLRTPWTVRSEVIWTRTHRRLGRSLFLWSAVWAAVLPFVSIKTFFFGHLGTMIAIKIACVVYSWRLSRSQKASYES